MNKKITGSLSASETQTTSDIEQELRKYLSCFLYERGLRSQHLLLSQVLSTLETQATRWLTVQRLDTETFTPEQRKLLALHAMCDVGMQVN